MGDTVYQFTVTDINGQKVSLEKYRGKVLVIVNVASKWGKTDVNYKQLVELHNKHSEAAGLQILGFPCNQFGGQEPGTDQEVKEFATTKYGVKWDLFSKVDVNGGNADPLWNFLKEKQSGFLINAIKWNFTKFVIDRTGHPVARLGPMDDPIPAVENEVKKYFWLSKIVISSKM